MHEASHNGPTECPTWCTTPADVHAGDDPGLPLHTATIQGCAVAQMGDQPLTVCIDDEEHTAQQLRELAQRLLRVTDWMDAQ